MVNFTLTGTATRAQDYGVSGGNAVTIPTGQTSANIPVTVTNDALAEVTETVICTISTSANYTVGSPSSATVNIADNESSGGSLPTVTLSSNDTTASETNPNTGTITITRNGSTTSALTVHLSYSGLAGNGADFFTLPNSVIIAAAAPPSASI